MCAGKRGPHAGSRVTFGLVTITGLVTPLPTEEGSNPVNHALAVAKALKGVCEEVGLHDGSTVGSLVARMATAETAIATAAANDLVVATVASRTALAAIASGSRADLQVVRVLADASGLPCGSTWQFSAASSLAADGLVVESCNIVVVPASGTGRWLRLDQEFVAKIAVDHATADAAQLTLVPAGYSVKITSEPFWDVVTGFTGGTNAAIGVSSSNAGSSTKGDLLGGAGGDLTATLGTAGVKQGTAGVKMDTIAHRRALRIEATEYLRFDRVADNYAAGAGYVHVPMALSRIG